MSFQRGLGHPQSCHPPKGSDTCRRRNSPTEGNGSERLRTSRSHSPLCTVGCAFRCPKSVSDSFSSVELFVSKGSCNSVCPACRGTRDDDAYAGTAVVVVVCSCGAPAGCSPSWGSYYPSTAPGVTRAQEDQAWEEVTMYSAETSRRSDLLCRVGVLIMWSATPSRVEGVNTH